MTVSVSTSSVVFLGNNSTSVFQFDFIIGTASNAFVYYTDTSGNQTLLAPSQYILFLNPPAPGALWGIGGTLTFLVSGQPIPNGSSLTLQRLVPFTQTTSISNQGDFFPQAVEIALDTLCFEIQQLVARTGQFRGTWATNVNYNFGDIVVDGANGADTGNWYMCISSNLSGVWATDLANGDWSLALDIQAIVTAITGATGFTSTSLTTNTIGTGTFTFVTQSGKQYQSGQFVTISDSATPGNYIFGQVQSYNTTTGVLIVNEVSFAGTGTISSWNISLSGAEGPAGGVSAGGNNIFTGLNTFTQITDFSAVGIKLGDIFDVNGNIALAIQAFPSSVNFWAMRNGATGVNPTLSVDGSDTNISQFFQAKGNGSFNFNASASAATKLFLFSQNSTHFIGIGVPAVTTNDYTLTLPLDAPSSTQFLTVDNTGQMGYSASALFPYNSGFLSYVNGTAQTLTHSLGAPPSIIVADFECQSTEGGYSPGDIIYSVTSFSSASSSPGTDYGFSLNVDSGNTTQLNFRVGAQAIILGSKTAGSNFILTPAKWKIRIKAGL